MELMQNVFAVVNSKLYQKIITPNSRKFEKTTMTNTQL